MTCIGVVNYGFSAEVRFFRPCAHGSLAMKLGCRSCCCSLMWSYHLVEQPRHYYEWRMYMGRALASPTPMSRCCIGVFCRNRR